MWMENVGALLSKQDGCRELFEYVVKDCFGPEFETLIGPSASD